MLGKFHFYILWLNNNLLKIFLAMWTEVQTVLELLKAQKEM